MKKVLSAVMALAICLFMQASCFAAGAAKGFAAEEKSADALIDFLTGGTATFEQVSKSFSDGLKKNLTAQNAAALQKRINEQVGKVKDINFVAYSKRYNAQSGYNGVDDLAYFGNAGAGKLVRVIVTFVQENNAPKIAEFSVTPVEPAQEGQQAKK